MIKNPLFTSAIISLSIFFISLQSASADDSYDVKTNGPKNPIVWNKPIKATFVHEIHTVDAEIECSSCHDDIFFMQRGVAVRSGKFTMAAMADGQFCGACHDGDGAFSTESNCMACHTVSEDPIVWKTPTKTSFSHKSHVEEFELECSDCHSGIFSMKIGSSIANTDFTMAAFKDGKYCGSCHNGDDAFSSSTQCESCHYPPNEKIVFTKPVKTVVFDHDTHINKAEISCESCHKEVFAMKGGELEGEKLAFSDDPAEKRKYLVELHNKFCGTCHDSSQAFGYLTKCTVCHIGVKGDNKMNQGDSSKDTHEKSGH